MFNKMTDKELRAYIDGCHSSREYDGYFESAAREYHSRQAAQWKAGDRVTCNGYPGTITKVCEGQLLGMVEVHLPGGWACVSASAPSVIRA